VAIVHRTFAARLQRAAIGMCTGAALGQSQAADMSTELSAWPGRELPDHRDPSPRLALVALGSVAALFVAVRRNRTASIDLAISLRLQAARSPALGRLMWWVSRPGFAPYSAIIPAGIATLLGVRGWRLEAGLAVVACGSAPLADALKAVTRRARPLSPEVRVVVARLGGSSFPSGHVLTYVAIYGFAAHVASCTIHRRWPRTVIAAPLVALVALIGPSRVYLGHHWPTDVLASYLLGFAYLSALTTMHARLRRPE
jgi:undecaprenyl-diphosphatase